MGAFSLVANATYANAQQQPAGASGYFQAQYMPKMIYTISSEYNVIQAVSVGLAVTGNTSYTDGGNANWPGSEVFTGFVRYRPAKNLEFGLQGYNLFDKFDARASGGVSDASVTPAVASVGAALGRTVMGTVKLSF